MKYIVLTTIVLLFILGGAKLANTDIITSMEGAISIMASYILLFIGSKHNLLPSRINHLVKWLTNTTDKD